MLYYNRKPPLLVGSVFVPHNRAKIWYKLQMQFLRQTSPYFLHVVCVNGKMDNSIFDQSEVIVGDSQHSSLSNVGKKQSDNHSKGLMKLIEYFKQHKADSYLILDSDCFPILNNWHQILLSKMNNFQIAAPIRYENLDNFPHPCAMFIKPYYLENDLLNLELGNNTNLLGQTYQDVGCNINLKDCYPLLRSNVYNTHPILSAVYHHMFYHHGCGSRILSTRSVQSGYFDHYHEKNNDVQNIEKLFHDLQAAPHQFINKLIGKTF